MNYTEYNKRKDKKKNVNIFQVQTVKKQTIREGILTTVMWSLE